MHMSLSCSATMTKKIYKRDGSPKSVAKYNCTDNMLLGTILATAHLHPTGCPLHCQHLQTFHSPCHLDLEDSNPNLVSFFTINTCTLSIHVTLTLKTALQTCNNSPAHDSIYNTLLSLNRNLHHQCSM